MALLPHPLGVRPPPPAPTIRNDAIDRVVHCYTAVFAAGIRAGLTEQECLWATDVALDGLKRRLDADFGMGMQDHG